MSPEDTRDSAEAGVRFAREVLAGLPDEVGMKRLVTVTRDIRRLGKDTGFAPAQITEMVEAFVSAAENEWQRITVASGNTPWGRA